MSVLPRLFSERFAPEVEADYQAQLGPEKLRVVRLAAWVAMLLFTGFGAMDAWSIPGAVHEVWVLRAAADLLALGFVALSLWRPAWLLAGYTPLIACYYSLFGVVVVAMVTQAQPHELASTSYWAGLLLVSAALYAFTYLSAPAAGLAGLFILACYAAIGVGVLRMVADGRGAELAANCFFLVGVNIIGLVAVNIRERFSREAYLLKNALQRDVELKDEERRRSLHLAEHDALTGLPNRARVMRDIDEMIRAARALRRTVAVLFIDLDGFKQVNDTWGHHSGDLLLQAVGRRLRACLRPTDLVGRLGGDEFVVAVELPGDPAEPIQRLGGDIVDAVSAPVAVDGRALGVSASIGAALFPTHGADAASVLAAADAQMYDAKRAGKAAVRIASGPAMRPVPAGAA